MLVLLTHAYPYGDGEIFLEQELPYLLEEFSKITIVPLFSEGAPRPLPERVDVLPLPKKGKIHKISRSLLEPNTYKELLQRPDSISSIKKLKYLFGYTSYCNKLYSFLKKQIESHPEWKNALFYTYWLHLQASALAKLKQTHHPDLTFVSRAHGYDVYEKDYWPGYIPMRQLTLSQIDHIFTVSQDGKRYLSHPRSTLSRIGTEDPKFRAKSSENNHISIVSCSHMVKEKRIERIIHTLAELCKLEDRKILWNHFGSGPLMEQLCALGKSTLPQNIKWKLHGSVPNSEIFAFYKTHPVDILISTSYTEGIPVSMMEAASCGIPIAATDVGGVREIVSNDNGALISRDTPPEGIAQAILKSLNHSKREASLEKWKDHFNMDTNYRSFAKSLSHFVTG